LIIISKIAKKNMAPKQNRLSPLLILIPALLTIFGVFMIYEASSINAGRLYGDAFLFAKQQLKWFGLAIFIYWFFLKFDYHHLYSLALVILAINIVLLILIFIPGFSTTILGAKRWLSLGPLHLQPSEFTKFSLIVYLSAWFSYKERGRFFAFVLLVSLLIGLVILQPDMGTASILGLCAVFLYFVSGAPYSQFFLLIIIGLLVGGFFILSSPYRLTRLTAYLDPQTDPKGTTYHISQVNTALSLGGWFGTGYGSSKQKFQFLPEAHTDSIFAIVGENFGFFGITILISTYLIFFYNLYLNIVKIKDKLGFLLASSILFLLLTQCLINLAAMAQLIPLTGIPLPFISYGGSSLLTLYALLGIMYNIFKYHKTYA
jgi:cell division protein FtsW